MRKRWLFGLISPAAVVAGVLAMNGAPGGDLRGSARVVDGDTLVVSGRRVRLVGVDAAEKAQTCGVLAVGRLATEAARAAVAGQPVRCTVLGRDRYGRDLGRCTSAGGEDVAGAVVAAGGAVLYDLQQGWRYLPDLAAAVLARRGAWSVPLTDLAGCELPSTSRHRRTAG